jgi:type I restriction enzyme, R subunit
MASPTSSNFQFLTAHDTLLVALGAQAERYFAEDPNTCLMKLRQFGERLAQRAAAHFNLPANDLKQSLSLTGQGMMKPMDIPRRRSPPKPSSPWA